MLSLTPDDASLRWSSYYKLTQELPSAERIRPFLDQVPQGGRILDFGCGTARFALGFLRDRSDVTVDVLDRTLSQALPRLENLAGIGQKIERNFEEWEASPRHYDAIWAHASLFFVPQEQQAALFGRLAVALKPDSVLAFTFVEDTPEGRAMRFYGTDEARLKTLLSGNGLTISRWQHDRDAKYGPGQAIIPTFNVTARNTSPEFA